MFTKELIQAISDWQRSSNDKRGAVLKAEALKLPEHYRHTEEICYRKIAFDSKLLLFFGTHYELSEKISAWSKSPEAAKDIKGFPDVVSCHDLIFSIKPPKGSVILDFTALFNDPDFVSSVETHKNAILGFSEGMGRYWNEQEEVVIELKRLPNDALRYWSGRSSSADKLCRLFLKAAYGVTNPSKEQLDFAKRLTEALPKKPGDTWVDDPETLKRIRERLREHCERIQ